MGDGIENKSFHLLNGGSEGYHCDVKEDLAALARWLGLLSIPEYDQEAFEELRLQMEKTSADRSLCEF